MRTLCLLLLSCLGCFGQAFSFADPTVGAWGGAPSATTSPLNDVTNLAGYPCYVFYLVDGGYVTNGSIVTLTDSMGRYNVTNGGAASSWPVGTAADLNGYLTITFNNSQRYMSSTAYTNWSPFEMVVVQNPNVITNGNKYVASTAGNAPSILTTAGGNWRMQAANTLNGSIVLTNKWQVYDFIFNGTSSSSWTNNSQDIATGNAGAAVCNGMSVGAAISLAGNIWGGKMAAIAIYGGGNAIPGTNTTARGKVYTALTNFFALSP